MAQRAAERVTRAQAVHDLHPDRRHDLAARLGRDKHALAAELDDRQARPEREQRRGGRLGLELADGDGDLGTVSDDDGGMAERGPIAIRC